jgi:hypothetical protein
VGWGLVGLAVGAVRGALLVAAGIPRELVLPLVTGGALRWAAFGAVGGAIFAGALFAARGRLRSIEALPPGRASRWGALAGVLVAVAVLAIPLAVGAPLLPAGSAPLVLGLATTAGAGLAGGVVAVARRAPVTLPGAGDARRLPPAG